MNISEYTRVAKLLHWLIAGLIIVQYILAELAERADTSRDVVSQLALLANHKSIGMTVLFLSVLRFSWRLFNKPPVPVDMPVWQIRASHLTHWLIYGLIFALPLTGWLMSSANAYSVSWFNVFVFPDLVGSDKALAQFFNNTHTWLSDGLFVLVVVHALAALKHHFFDKDVTLKRMASPVMYGVLLVTIIISLISFGRVFPTDKPSVVEVNVNDSLRDGSVVNTIERKEVALSDLPLWNIDYDQSYIRFTADQAGAPFDGNWTKWTAQMQFDPNALTSSGFDVLIETSNVDSGDDERDAYIVGNDFFDTSKHQTARFFTNTFTALGGEKFSADALLSIKGLSKRVEFTFTVTKIKGMTVLEGSATLDRLAWNVGMGDWQDATWVGHDVLVSVKVVAKL